MSTSSLETKSNLKHATLEGLQDLLQANTDSAKGFEQVADSAEAPLVEARFGDRAAERRVNADKLRGLIEQNGEEPKSEGSWLAAFHRNWIAIKANLSGDSESLLNEIERGEQYLADKYESVLKDEPGSAVSDVLHGQLAGVKEVIRLVQAERDKLGD